MARSKTLVRKATKRSYDAVFDLYVEMPSLSFADRYHLILAQQWCDGMLISFAEKIGRVPGITRRVQAHGFLNRIVHPMGLCYLVSMRW